MSRTIPLNTFANVKLDSSGNGTAQVGPNIPGVTWIPTTAAVFTTSTANTPLANLYLGSVSPVNFLGGTYDGNNDSTDLSVTVMNGMQIFCQWTGGDAGAQATLSIFGTQTVPGR
jgi:hypothetical protein